MIRPLILIAIPVWILAAGRSAAANPRDDMLDGISRCNSISDDRGFLDCVYGAAQPLRAELGLSPAPESQTRLVPPIAREAVPMAQSSKDQPGIFGALFGSGKVEVQLQPMVSYTFRKGGYFVVTLSNGQIWRQLDSDVSFANWRRPASSYYVTIRSGSMGSYNLEVKNQIGLYKVERIR